MQLESRSLSKKREALEELYTIQRQQKKNKKVEKCLERKLEKEFEKVDRERENPH